MYFSDRFGVDRSIIEQYGAIDVSLVCDIPLFVDPMLIFNNGKYKKLHDQIIKYFNFLYEKSQKGVSKSEMSAYFKFSEVKNNWFGYSKSGNEGKGLGNSFALFLSQHLPFILNQEHEITQGQHIEKALLIYDGSGKDKISDMATYLILDFLAAYTQEFALKNIDKNLLYTFPIDCGFNYETETSIPKQFTLPFINNSNKKEYVLLTPIDILRKDEPAISKSNLKRSYSNVRDCIDNDVQRLQLNNYITKKISEYLLNYKPAKKNKKPSKSQIEKVEKEAFKSAFDKFPWLYDYFIKFVELNGSEITAISYEEVAFQIEKFRENSEKFIKIFQEVNPTIKGQPNSRDELIERIKYFKYCIEDCDCYKCFYTKDGKRISTEDDLQRFFRFVWIGTIFDITYESNNGRGELDVKVSFGAKDKTIGELKLASNPNLKDIFEQVKIYEKANKTTYPSVFVIFCFDQKDILNVQQLKNQYSNVEATKDIFTIDCRRDNKVSGSKVRQEAKQ